MRNLRSSSLAVGRLFSLVIILVLLAASAIISTNKAKAVDSTNINYPAVTDPSSGVTGKLPGMLVGGTELTIGTGATTTTWYGGLTGNYAVFNYDPPYELGFESSLLNCQDENGLVPAAGACFVLNKAATTSVRLMKSQTKAVINGKTEILTETPALLFAKTLVTGDTYGADNLNLNYLGKSYAFSGKTIDPNNGSALQFSGYTPNSKADSAWDGKSFIDTGSSAFKQYGEKVETLIKTGTTVDASALTGCGTWFLQSKDICSNDSEADKYPEGKVWIIKSNPLSPDFQIKSNTTISYIGTGTIIVVGGNVVVGKDAEITPIGSSHLGFIVLDK
ncbi:MAG: hypothetical protein NTW50_02765 [Candidatus Berkelbacteria bacterium]|nr:hypothetical protein [Candidatus Berkelbacteria bacterium]